MKQTNSCCCIFCERLCFVFHQGKTSCNLSILFEYFRSSIIFHIVAIRELQSFVCDLDFSSGSGDGKWCHHKISSYLLSHRIYSIWFTHTIPPYVCSTFSLLNYILRFFFQIFFFVLRSSVTISWFFRTICRFFFHWICVYVECEYKFVVCVCLCVRLHFHTKWGRKKQLHQSH